LALLTLLEVVSRYRKSLLLVQPGYVAQKRRGAARELDITLTLQSQQSLPMFDQPARYRLLGVEVDAVTVSDLNTLVERGVGSDGPPRLVAHHNLHSLYLIPQSPKMRRLYDRADYIHIDGMSFVALGQWLGLPLRPEHRVTYVDWVHPLLGEANEQQWRIFYLGAKPGVIHDGIESIRSDYPGLQIEGHDGYFDPTGPDNERIVEQINAFQTDILMVGMGMPRQEAWILDNIDRIKAHVVLPCGACIDYIAGAVPTPPRWMGRAGLEWLYRLIQEPKRLWRRCFIEPWWALWLFAQEMYSQKNTSQVARMENTSYCSDE
jgi:N-acetylglucosaminyldiphosphoundecaprenol N-acetyl-beta-D-mannosaminyltransferase